MPPKIRVALMYSDNTFASPINPEVTFGWGNYDDFGDEEAALVLEMHRDGRFDVFNFTWQDITPELTFRQIHNLLTGERLEHVPIDETVDVIFVRGVGSSQRAHDFRGTICERLQLLKQLSRTKVINPVETVISDLESKRYLVKLFSAGVPMPATYLARSLAEIEEIGKQLSQGYVIKPVQGFGGFGIERFPGGSVAQVEQFLSTDGEVLVQEFIPGIAQGERSVMMTFQEAAYAILKRPHEGDFRSNFSHGATIVRAEPNEAEVLLCREVLKHLELPSIISRIDLIGPREAPMLMEATMSCMGLYLRDVHAESEIAQVIMDTIEKAVRAEENGLKIPGLRA
ncbi:MAG TPA: hypothetical protein PLL06_07790 [Acidobacteriota bacterium]|nr:hypothetical protein [Acidobacteriota bacterium]HNB71403.1 hypothetical protein [Acidobacteriota bacterium]HND18075.1 hypothetical protein [Acidobacteriota bacterium]HNG94991.1 hypothetical protein [Acidobacteriota bacterium]